LRNRPAHFDGQSLLRLFFNRLVRLAELPIAVIFVEDGENRPNKSRNKRNATSMGSLPLVDGMKKLANAFGFSWFKVSPSFRFIVLRLC